MMERGAVMTRTAMSSTESRAWRHGPAHMGVVVEMLPFREESEC
jgi:hypothetical protein